MNEITEEKNDQESKPRLLLHSCCGPCSTAVLERLYGQYEITLFFYNPNIADPEEYEKRKVTQLQFLEAFNRPFTDSGIVAFLEGPYDSERFLSRVKGLEDEPEGGARCSECFAMRLEMTADFAKREKADLYGTTLSVSPHKNHREICRSGQQYEADYGVPFLTDDFKKKAGYQRSVQLSREYGLYRQNFCGCPFSKNQA